MGKKEERRKTDKKKDKDKDKKDGKKKKEKDVPLVIVNDANKDNINQDDADERLEGRPQEIKVC